MTEALPVFRDLRIEANGLEHRVLEWKARASATGAAGAPRRTVVLVHGFMDAAATWDRVAPALAAAGHRVLAPDMRGFGEGARAPGGSYYHFPDYVADLAELFAELVPADEPIGLVGHSMGGTITTLFAGTFPERVARLVNIEGLGPPDNPFEAGPTRMRRWIEDVRRIRARGGNAPMSIAEARRRLALNHPGVPPDVLDDRLGHLAEEDELGRLTWHFDPRHRSTSPTPFFAKLFIAYAALVTCPVLFVSGGASGFHVPDEPERLAAFADVERVTLEGAGHMVHWTRPDELAAALLGFL